MDFEVTIGDEVRVFEQFYDAVSFITDKMAQWNNFQPETTFYVRVRKVSSETDTLGVNVGDVMDVGELLFRP